VGEVSSYIYEGVTNNGRANKTDIIQASKNRGWNVKDDNKADAILLLEYTISELGGV
jgi:hypothetical protein